MLLFMIFEDSLIAEFSDVSMAVSVISNSCMTVINKQAAFIQKHKYKHTHSTKKQEVLKIIMPTTQFCAEFSLYRQYRLSHSTSKFEQILCKFLYLKNLKIYLSCISTLNAACRFSKFLIDVTNKRSLLYSFTL